MSENNFKVPAKSAPTKRATSEKKDNVAKEKEVKKKSTTGVKKVSSTTKKTSSSATAKKSTNAKKSTANLKKAPVNDGEKKQVKSSESSIVKKVKNSNLTFEKQELPDSNPSLANLTLEERLAFLNGKDSKKKEDKPKEEEKKEARSEITSLMESVKKNTSATLNIKQEEKPLIYKRKEKSNTSLQIFLLLVIVLLILIIVLLVKKRAVKVENSIKTEEGAISKSYDEVNYISITSGMSASQVASILPSFLDKNAFLNYLRQNNLTGSIMVGSYEILPTYNEADIATIITTKSVSDSVVVYPGYTINDIDLALSNRGLAGAGDFIKASEEYATQYGLSFIEGYFLAGEYKFSNCFDLLNKMHDSLLDILKSYPDAVAESGLSIDEIVKIASIINRETQDNEQFKVIASIILNRYRQNMPLGIDATTRYELNNWSDVISQSIYEKDSPYNTRRKPGLPPSGIGCPSEAAVLAVLFPSQIDALYYLHDKEGKLYTSLSYEEHLKTYEKVHFL